MKLPPPAVQHRDEAAQPPPPSPQEGHASVDYVLFEVAWMVQIRRNASGQVQWVQLPRDMETRLEDMYLDASTGEDEFVV